MPKTCFKTFVYSFCTSLFVIFVINSAFWHASPSKSENIQLPNKNIMLFLNGTQANPSAKPAPTKKIQLTKLEDVKTTPQVVYQPENDIILAEEPSATSEIILADALPEIPLDISITAPAPNEKAVVYAEEVKSPPHPIFKDNKAESAPLPAHSSAQQKEKISIPLSAPKILPTALASKENNIILSEKAEPAPLLPLQKDVNAPNKGTYKVRDSLSAPENRVALTNKSIPVSGMITSDTKKTEEASTSKKNWQQMSEKTAPNDSPWVVAQSAGAHKNSLLKNEHFSKDKAAVDAALNNKPLTNKDYELLLASETVKNLLIPIPEDILNDENLTPQLISPSSPEGIEREAAIDEQIKKKHPKQTKENATKEEKPEDIPRRENITPLKEPNTATDSDKKKSILSSLSSIFQADTKQKRLSAQTSTSGEDSLIDSVKKKLRRNKGKIMPTEMRLSFQPNRAEISGQTLRWIQAFATRTATDKNLGLEIRIDGTSARELQQKRLNLLQNILINRGVPFSKINTVFTNREPNSFIIRTTSLRNDETGDANRINNRTNGMYLQW